jgi:hypothetical protein
MVYDCNMCMERWFNDTDSERPGHAEKNISWRHGFHHKSHLEGPGTEPGLPRCETGNGTPVMHDLQYINRVGLEIVTKPAMLALQPKDTDTAEELTCLVRVAGPP